MLPNTQLDRCLRRFSVSVHYGGFSGADLPSTNSTDKHITRAYIGTESVSSVLARVVWGPTKLGTHNQSSHCHGIRFFQRAKKRSATETIDSVERVIVTAMMAGPMLSLMCAFWYAMRAGVRSDRPILTVARGADVTTGRNGSRKRPRRERRAYTRNTVRVLTRC